MEVWSPGNEFSALIPHTQCVRVLGLQDARCEFHVSITAGLTAPLPPSPAFLEGWVTQRCNQTKRKKEREWRALLLKRCPQQNYRFNQQWRPFCPASPPQRNSQHSKSSCFYSVVCISDRDLGYINSFFSRLHPDNRMLPT